MIGSLSWVIVNCKKISFFLPPPSHLKILPFFCISSYDVFYLFLLFEVKILRMKLLTQPADLLGNTADGLWAQAPLFCVLSIGIPGLLRGAQRHGRKGHSSKCLAQHSFPSASHYTHSVPVTPPTAADCLRTEKLLC